MTQCRHCELSTETRETAVRGDAARTSVLCSTSRDGSATGERRNARTTMRRRSVRDWQDGGGRNDE